MIVDDSKMIRSTLKMYLESGNHEVVFAAENGKQAVEAYKIYNPDLVTMDISMPEMDGMEAVRLIKKMDENAKIIMLSALNEKEMVLTAIKNGATNYLLKPVDKVKTLKTIENVLKG
jgi:two-component system chemotaxis response regulator CheY